MKSVNQGDAPLQASDTSDKPVFNFPQPDAEYSRHNDSKSTLETRRSRSTPPTYTPPKDRVALNIVVQVVGSRGDVQPFLALGKALQAEGHRIRIATHPRFRDFVSTHGLEYFDIGGDPAELMAFMTENSSLIPNLQQIREGTIQRKREMYRRMLEGFWRSCTEADERTFAPFVADAIIANPPSFAHVHCAQALGIPLHLMFTMPWSPTENFPHPLANVSTLKSDSKIINQASYAAVEMLTWQGLGDLVNEWRVSTLNLERVPGSEGHRLLEGLKVPMTYCWSPSLVPKPNDWGSHIDVCGFFFRDSPPFKPSADLIAFLEAGTKPIYVGFGSIVVNGGEALLTTVINAIHKAGVRAIISGGWSGMLGDSTEDTYFIEDCPHEWLFQQVAAVVHHGGAGTTACGLRFGKPTLVIPFFGDQYFWGSVIAQAGAGPPPIMYRSLTSEQLAKAIAFCLTPEAVQAAETISFSMSRENGVAAAVEAFHRQLPSDRMSCDFLTHQPAALMVSDGKHDIKMCKPIASLLLRSHKISKSQITSYRSKPFTVENTRMDPITAFSSAWISTLYRMIRDTADTLVQPIQDIARANPRPVKIVQKARQSEAPSFSMLPLTEMPALKELLHRPHKAPKHNDDDTVAGRQIAVRSLNQFGKLVGNTAKGFFVDIPLAVTEGLRAVPQAYGDPAKEHASVENFRGGVAVAGKTFAADMTGGFTDVFKYTYTGKKDSGAAGATKGLAKGAVSFVTKTSGAVLGLVAYPAQGLYRSIWSSLHRSTREVIVECKLMEGNWLLAAGAEWQLDSQAIGHDLDGLRGQR